jgi:small-conductance mechanosensitive channel
MQRVKLATLGILMVLFAWSAWSQEPSQEASVHVNGRTLFVLRSGVGSFSAAERAAAVNQRLREVLGGHPATFQTVVQKSDIGLLITANDITLIAVTDRDAQAESMTAEALANRWALAIQEGLLSVGRERLRQTLWKRILITAGALIGVCLVVVILWKARKRIVGSLEARRHRIPALRFRQLEIMPAEKIFQAAVRFVVFLVWIILLLVGTGALLLIFSQFPQTRGYAQQVALWIWQPLVIIAGGIVSYLPNFFYILVILLVTRFIVRGLSFIFEQAHLGVISLEPWIHQDVARPTSQILKGIIAVLALFFIAPLIPGTGSRAAQGISVVLGLMVSFGSTSTVGNLIAGIVLTYMRPFHRGDRVKLGETVGDVIERTFLYTKLLTIKNEEVMVPSLQALSGTLTNYSARATQGGLILHTTVTIGYDAPWRTVHELLIRAAERTTHVLKEPKPFVLQTSLDDFYISYQLNLYTNEPNKMATIYAELHQHIQDSFNEGGVEIMSPHYYQLRDGNTLAIPGEYLSKTYESPRFLVDTRIPGNR